MAIKKNQVARGVRVKLNNLFEEKCLGDQYLSQEEVLFIKDEKIYFDTYGGDFVYIEGGILINTGYAYLNQLDLEFPIPELPLYDSFGETRILEEKAKLWWGGISDENKYSIAGIVVDHLLALHLDTDQIVDCYKWVKSISPK